MDRGTRSWRCDGLAALALVLAGAWFSFGVLAGRAVRGEGTPSFDIYAYFYPNVLYALRALEQGHGLLWSSAQNCGQPFFANPQSALLYPPNWIFLVADPDTGLLLLTFFHLFVAGAGTYLLCRTLGLDRLSSLAGGLAFELGGNTLGLAGWMPIVSAGYAWMPVAVWAAEELLARRSRAHAVGLAAVLAVQLFAGQPQVSFFTYQILFVRLLWSLATRSGSGTPALLLVAAMCAAPMLAAVQLLPAAELASESLRSASLTPQEADGFVVSWKMFQSLLDQRITGPGTMFTIVACMLAGAAAVSRSAPAVYYFVLALLFTVLGFQNFLSELYRLLPLSTVFRGIDRFHWPAGFCFSVVVAFGVSSLLPATKQDPTDRSRLVRAAFGMALGTAAFLWLAGGALRGEEWVLLSVVLVAGVALLAGGSHVRAAGSVLLVVALASNLAVRARDPMLGLLRDAPAEISRNEPAFDFVAHRLTVSDRIYTASVNDDYGLMRKSASLFGLNAALDYEPLTSRRFAEYFIKMMYGAGADPWMGSVHAFYYMTNGVPRNRSLLNLAGVRILVVDERVASKAGTALPFEALERFGGVTVYDNAEALPRAFFVPSLRVVPDWREKLRTLASRSFSARSAALVSAPPEDGHAAFPASEGSAEIESDRSEELRLRASSTAGGFVFVSDQYYPGWTATVNGQPTEILVANHAFRAVRIPAGASEVVFRYRPLSVRIGFGISAAAFVLLVMAWWAVVRGRDRGLIVQPGR